MLFWRAFAVLDIQARKGTMISSNIRITHTLDPVVATEDSVRYGYKPERWLDESTKPTTDFVPFGVGPHYCLGATLAMAEMKIFLAVAARCTDFELVGSTAEDGPVLWKTRFSIIPKHNFDVRKSKLD